jgi:diguanylate cyclase (GGDEF)-like protein/PAS domain S-box-containing protein
MKLCTLRITPYPVGFFMHIDPFSIVVFTVIISLLMSAGLFVMSRDYLSDVKGIRHWATALLLLGIGWVLFALYGFVPNFFSMVIGTTIILSAVAFYFYALVAFKEVCVPVRWTYLVLAIAFIGHIYFVHISFNMSAKIALTSTCTAVLLCANSFLLFSKPHGVSPISQRLTGTIFAVGASVYTIRAIYYLVWNTQAEQTLFQHNIIQDISYLTNPTVIVGSAFGFGLMCNEKYLGEKNKAQLALKKSISLLNATLESTADALLVVELTGNVVQYNNQFVKMWGIPEPILDIRSNQLLLEFVLDQLVDPEGFVNGVIDIDSHHYDENFSELHFKDGRIIERYSRPQYLNNEPVGRVWSFRDVSERKQIEKAIKQLAFYDSLTQLPNRRLLDERLKHGIEINHRKGSQIAVLMMDLDKFKAVNDTLGHKTGDELLRQVAERIKTHLREMDMVARLGGDEFVILIEEFHHYEDLAHVADMIIHTLSQPFTLYGIHQVTIGASIGIAIHPDHGNTVEELIDNADTALYQAKDNGRGCFAYFSEPLIQKLPLI